jgi:BirA family transcriptional regulator, biotin operon repressor / biotin---[acetyl-CoA-carboxylase] ligase
VTDSFTDALAYPVHSFKRVGSTMDVIHGLAAEGAMAGTAVIAAEQLEGRGSRGRPWHSPVGGLWLSVLLRPQTVAGLEVVSLRVGLAVARAIEGFTGTAPELKWPNDLMLDHRKLGGILCEARWQGASLAWVTVGIGLNVQNRIPGELEQSAVALEQVCPGITPRALSEPIIAAVRQLDLSPERLSPKELEEFDRRNWLRGKQLKEPVHGLVTGVQNDGALLVHTHDGLIPLRSGSLELASPSGAH